MKATDEGVERMGSITGKLPEPGERAKKILDDPERYFAEARERNRLAIIAERKARDGRTRRRFA